MLPFPIRSKIIRQIKNLNIYKNSPVLENDMQTDSPCKSGHFFSSQKMCNVLKCMQKKSDF